MLDCAAREIDAMRLMLLRHAKSEKPEAGMSDHARRLNARGKRDAPVSGAYRAHHALIPDLVLVSMAERTRQTWERVAAALPTPPRVVYEDRLYNAGAERGVRGPSRQRRRRGNHRAGETHRAGRAHIARGRPQSGTA